MTSETSPTADEICRSAPLYVLDALSPDERRLFEQHLRTGCPACEVELHDLEHVARELAFDASPAAPPAAVRERLLQLLRNPPSQVTRRQEDRPGAILFAQNGVLISRSSEMEWIRAPLPGISSKVLSHDDRRNYTTQLVRMEPGTTYPSHHHREVEELYLLEGDLEVEGLRMKSGDYCRAEPGSIHSTVRTESGALFLVLSSQNDELLLA
jgi:quercetin dioxygenase-like cupin family protein